MKRTIQFFLLNLFILSSFAQNLNTVELGSSSNMFSVWNASQKVLASNQEINTFVFIHRSDRFLFNDVNENGKYRYDISTDGGTTWIKNIGPLNPSSVESGPSGRYPNVIIYNPLGNTDPGNAYLVYMGSYVEPGFSWNGIFTGVARLDNNPSTFTEHVMPLNNNNVQIAGTLVSSEPGVFWATVFSTYSNNTLPNGILILKGVWNDATKDVDWNIHERLNPPLDRVINLAGNLTDVAIDFDPTGQYGWIAFTGDITPGTPNGDVLYTPNFYYTKDRGDTWDGPMVLELPNFNGLLLNRVGTTPWRPQPTYDMDLAVDAHGRPNLLLSVGRTGPGYSYGWLFGVHELYNFQFDETAPDGCQWKAMLIDTLNGQDGAVMDNNKPQVIKSADATKLFFTWADSDFDGLVNGYENDFPNLFSRGYDVNTGMATPIINWTENDPAWKDKAYYPSPVAKCFDSGSTYNIPLVMARGDNTLDTTNYFFVSNIQQTDAQFNTTLFEICDPNAPKYLILTGIARSFDGTLIQNGTAILYDTDNPLFGYDTIATSAIDDSGRYEFTNVNPSEVVIQVIPDPSIYPNLATSYLRNVPVWKESDTVRITKNQPDTIACLQKPVLQGGTNIIRGRVISQFNNKRAEPIEDEDIIIKETPPGLVRAIGSTDEDGYFEFPGFGQGNFEIIVDYPGIPMFELNTVSITTDSNDINVEANVDSNIITFDYDSTKIDTGTVDTNTTFIPANALNDLEIFPNPTYDNISISFTNERAIEVGIRILGLDGKVFGNLTVQSELGEHVYNVDFQDQAPGIYILEIRSGDEKVLKKIQKL